MADNKDAMAAADACMIYLKDLVPTKAHLRNAIAISDRFEQIKSADREHVIRVDANCGELVYVCMNVALTLLSASTELPDE